MDDDLKQYLEGMRQETAAELAATRKETAQGFAEVRQEFAKVRQEMAAEFASVRQEMTSEFTTVRQEMASEFTAVRQENAAAHAETRNYVDRKIEEGVSELRLHFDSHAERLKSQIDLTVEGVANVHQALDRHTTDIRSEMRQGYANLHDLIKYGYSNRG